MGDVSTSEVNESSRKKDSKKANKKQVVKNKRTDKVEETTREKQLKRKEKKAAKKAASKVFEGNARPQKKLKIDNKGDNSAKNKEDNIVKETIDSESKPSKVNKKKKFKDVN